MPSKRPSQPQGAACQHSRLTLSSSAAAAASAAVPYTPHQLFTAATGKRKHMTADTTSIADFPAPLGLPGDVLFDDPKYPPQSFRSWLNSAGRNVITAQRKVVYVAGPPDVWEGVRFMGGQQHVQEVQNRRELNTDIVQPDISDAVAYLRAYYHGVDVRHLPDELSWVPWESGTPKHRSSAESRILPGEVGLKTNKEIIRVRIRQASSKSKRITPGRDLFRYQVNQVGLLDVVETILPADACALLLIVNQDMYEDEDDDFCCGRAFGGSRIAVVSTARYDPVLDEIQDVDRQHAWPASHCAEFVAKACGREEKGPRSKKSCPMRGSEEFDGQDQMEGALSEAVRAHLEMSSRFDARTTYLLRVCRTASHEIGHCFGIDHCMFLACNMQGTCSLPEDNRQPPYLCPVCEAKLTYAVTKESAHSVSGWKQARHEAISNFCVSTGGAFAPLAAWTRSILGEMEAHGVEEES